MTTLPTSTTSEEAAASWVALDALTPWADNPRTNSHAVAAVAESIKRFGFASPIIARLADGMVIAGHTRLLAARTLGLDRVPVRFLDLDPADARLLALADNRVGEIADWDAEALAEVMRTLEDEGADLDGLGWTSAELEDLIGGGGASPGGEEGGDIPPPVEVVHSARGEVYELGPHRLICGDSTDAATLATLLEPWGGRVDLVITDPPYAIYGSSTGIGSDITDDKMIRPFFRSILERIQGISRTFGQVYVFGDWRSWSSWWEVARGTRLTPKNMLVWDKGGGGLGSSWAQAHELVAYFVITPEAKGIASNEKRGITPVHAPNLLRFSRTHGDERQHNASKPLDLLRYLIRKTDDGRGGTIETVADLFGGSGSTLIAADQEGKRAAMVEIEPRWCDVIRRRWTSYATENGLPPGPGALSPLGGEA